MSNASMQRYRFGFIRQPPLDVGFFASLGLPTTLGFRSYIPSAKAPNGPFLAHVALDPTYPRTAGSRAIDLLHFLLKHKLEDVLRRMNIPVMHLPALWADPFPVVEGETVIHITAIA